MTFCVLIHILIVFFSVNFILGDIKLSDDGQSWNFLQVINNVDIVLKIHSMVDCLD